MAKSSKGIRAETRHKLRLGIRNKFKPNDYLRSFEIGSKVVIKPNPASQKGMPHPRFTGLVGTVFEKRGRAYIVKLKLGKAEKTIIARPEHLKPIKAL